MHDPAGLNLGLPLGMLLLLQQYIIDGVSFYNYSPDGTPARPCLYSHALSSSQNFSSSKYIRPPSAKIEFFCSSSSVNTSQDILFL